MTMNEKIMFSDKQNKKDFYPLSLDNRQNKDEYVLTENDFYPPSDDRCLESYVRDIDGGDSFAEYCEYIFEICDEEGYWD
jgi:hypothetical protein